MSGAYTFNNEKNLRDSLAQIIPDYDYGREGNATNDCANEILTALDNGVRSQVFATGIQLGTRHVGHFTNSKRILGAISPKSNDFFDFPG
jgi:O-acetylhomoserine/O-acetylserine sulfhydrylase-like pyridoxal-dependent enzyme